MCAAYDISATKVSTRANMSLLYTTIHLILYCMYNLSIFVFVVELWLQCQWAGSWLEESISTKELLPIVLACTVWGPRWQQKQVLVQTDNMAVVHIINTQTSRDQVIMHLVRCLHFICAFYEIQLRAVHLAGSANIAADALSRNLMQVFRKAVPAAETLPTLIPPTLWQLLVTQRPDWRSPAWRQLLTTSLRTVSLRAQGERMDRPRQNSSTSVQH